MNNKREIICANTSQWIKLVDEVDPFCGWGSVPAIANAMGLDSVGVEILPEFCEKSRQLKVSMLS